MQEKETKPGHVPGFVVFIKTKRYFYAAMGTKYKFHHQSQHYFVSFSVVNWIAML
jgi:hypothetical protein